MVAVTFLKKVYKKLKQTIVGVKTQVQSRTNRFHNAFERTGKYTIE
jgi:hypothetical protein